MQEATIVMLTATAFGYVSISTTTSQPPLNTSAASLNSSADESTHGVTGDVAYFTSRVIFILILFGGLAANCVLVVGVVRGQRRRGSRAPPQLNVMLIGTLAVANLLICLSNASWLIYTAVAGPRSDAYSRRPCDSDAAAIQLVSIVWVIGLMLMVSDREVAVKSVGASSSSTSNRGFSVSLSILCTILAWLYALAFSVPLVIPGGIRQEGNPQRYLCTIDSNASAAYVWTTAFFGYIGPFGVIVAMYVGIIATTIQQRKKLAAAAQTFINSISNASADQFREQKVALSIELSTSKYMATLTVVWCLLAAPFLVMSFVRIQLTEYNQPAVSYPSNLDAIFTWLFVSHPISLPLITFIWRKDVCCRCIRRIFVCFRCCTDELPDDIVVYSGSLTPKHRQRMGTVDPYNVSHQTANSLPAVPVLFATPHGLHVQTYPNPANGHDCSADSGRPKQCAQKCDVFGSVCSKRAFRMEDNDEDAGNDNTSDYNSCDGSGDDEEKEYMDQAPNGRPIIRIVKYRSTDPADGAILETGKTSYEENIKQSTGRTTWYDGLDIGKESSCEPKIDRYGDSGVGSWNKNSKTIKKSSDDPLYPVNATNNIAASIELESLGVTAAEEQTEDQSSLSVPKTPRFKNAKKKKGKRKSAAKTHADNTESGTIRKDGRQTSRSPRPTDAKLKTRSASANAIMPHSRAAVSQQECSFNHQTVVGAYEASSQGTDGSPSLKRSNQHAVEAVEDQRGDRALPTRPPILPRRKTNSESHTGLLESSGSTVDLRAIRSDRTASKVKLTEDVGNQSDGSNTDDRETVFE